ncbi:unnamed protein product [Peronospora effusa]|nr:unnamed protein product [Peronospora effusa]
MRIHPSKSQLIFLNRSVKLEQYEGIDVVPTGETTRYLGYEIGTGELVNKNWAQRIHKIQRRLLTATRVATSVENRVLLLNSIVLPFLLFTAIVFALPRWAEKDLHNLYKQFLWAHATTTESSRHKVNPGLLVTPKQAGGIGLAAVSVAVKTQRIKHTVTWITQKPDKYFDAWRVWAFRGSQGPDDIIVTPAQAKLRASPSRARSPEQEVKQELGERLAPTTDQHDQLTAWIRAHSTALLDRVTSWWDGDKLMLSFIDPFLTHLLGYNDMLEEIQRFWATFKFSANQWIWDQSGNMMSRTKYNRIEDCTLEHLHILRTGPAEFVMRVPIPPVQPGSHSDAKLRRWVTALLLPSPDLPIGTELNATPPLRLRQEPPQLKSYR